MRIVDLTAYHVRIRLRKPIVHASHTRNANDTLIVRCRLDDGTIGWGEGLPRTYVTGETIESTIEQLESADLPRLLGPELQSLTDAVALCENLSFPTPAHDLRDCFGNALCCAVELAILDAVTRVLNLSIAAVFNELPDVEPLRTDLPRVQYSGVFTGMTPRKVIRRALVFRLARFRHAKIKVGISDVDDVANLRRIRRWFGSRRDLRVDANEAWRPAELERRLAPLVPFQITSVEQPVPHADVAALEMLRPRLPIPVMLDESLCSYSDAERAVERGLCDFFNIRLSKCGGLIRSAKLAAFAHAAGIGYQLGCQVGETGILSAAGRHFASHIANIRFLEGSYDRFLVRDRLTTEDLTFGIGGWAASLDGPGLGVHVDENQLAAVTKSQHVFPIQQRAAS